MIQVEVFVRSAHRFRNRFFLILSLNLNLIY
jgi:hypothetical protein